MQRPLNRLEQFSLRHPARPSAPELVFLLVHVFEADRFHLGHAPLFGFSLHGRSRHARANVIAQLGEVLEGVRIHHPFARNLDERRLRSILIRPFRRRPIVCPRRPRRAQRKSQCHRCHSRQNTSHPHSPYAFAHTNSSTVSDVQGMEPGGTGPQLPLYAFCIAEGSRQAESPPFTRHRAETPLPFRLYRSPPRTLNCHLWAR